MNGISNMEQGDLQPSKALLGENMNSGKQTQLLNEIITRLYTRIYNKLRAYNTFIFLCGSGEKDSTRNLLRVELEKRFYFVFYPEDLFMDMIAMNKNYDLLSFEELLADESDKIIVVCESIGSAAEMGAFVQNESTQKKLIICSDKDYKKKKSFINIGPIKYHELLKGSRYWFDKKDVISLANDIDHELKLEIRRKILHEPKKLPEIDLVEQKPEITVNDELRMKDIITFLPIIIWFFEMIERQEVYTALYELFIKNSKNKEEQKFKIRFNASINFLVKQRLIEIEYGDQKYNDKLRLSQEGIKAVKRILTGPDLEGNAILIDQIRCDIINLSLYGNL